MNQLINLFKALSDETRLRIIMLLKHKSHCVCELTEILELSQPKISKHLTKLKALGLVSTKKDATFVYYYLDIDSKALNSVLETLNIHKNTFSQFVEDESRVATCTVRKDTHAWK